MRTKIGHSGRLAVIATSILLSSCLLQLPTPSIDLQVEAGYSQSDVLIPYQLTGDEGYAVGRWTLRVWDGAEFSYPRTGEVRLPSGQSGVLAFESLTQAHYQLEFELLTTRNGSYEPVPYLTTTRDFWVDWTAPTTAVDVSADLNPPGNGTVMGTAADDFDVEVSYTQLSATGSPERVLFVTSSLRPPVPGEDELDGTTAHIWRANEFTVGDTVSVYFVVVDAAGNRGSISVATWGTN